MDKPEIKHVISVVMRLTEFSIQSGFHRRLHLIMCMHDYVGRRYRRLDVIHQQGTRPVLMIDGCALNTSSEPTIGRRIKCFQT